MTDYEDPELRAHFLQQEKEYGKCPGCSGKGFNQAPLGKYKCQTCLGSGKVWTCSDCDKNFYYEEDYLSHHCGEEE